MNVLSLFDGISCGAQALKNIGLDYDNYFASEIDRYAIQISQKNHPKIIRLGDVLNIDYRRLPKIDLLIAGSPCQGFSFAGKQLNFKDERSRLFFEFVKAKEILKPKWFLLENVKMKKQYQDIITNFIGVEPFLIDSEILTSGYRKRLYWTNLPKPELTRVESDKLSILESNNFKNAASLTIGTSKEGRIFRETNKFTCLTATMFKGVRAAGRPILGEMFLVGKNIDQVEKSSYRMLSPIECERLQTLPDNYTEGGK